MARRDTSVGLDVGRAAAKAVWLARRGDRVRAVRVESVPLPLDASDPAPIVKPWLERLGLAGHPCVVGLPGGLCMFQPIALPAEDPRTPQQAAGIEVLKYNEMVSDSMVFGFAPFALPSGDRRLLLSMARPSVVDETLETMRRIGVEVADLVPTPVALFNAVPRTGAPGAPRLYLNVGASATDLAVGLGDALLFARSFSVGGRMFTDAVARARRLTSSRAQSVKEGEGDLGGGDDPLAQALQTVADLWLSELRSCLSIYRSLYPGPAFEPSAVTLAGGGARLRGLPEYAAAKLGLPASVAPTCAGDPETAYPADFAEAAGLAVAGLDAAPVRVSLLPPALRDELAFRAQKPYWISAGVAASAILAVSLVGGYRDYQRKHRELQAQNQSLQRRQQLAAEIEGIEGQSLVLREMAAPLRHLVGAGPVLRDVVTLLSEARDPDDWITLVCDADSYFKPAKEKPEPAGGRRPVRERLTPDATGQPLEAPGLRRLVVAGYTRRASLASVRDLIARLKAAPFVESADLLSDDELVDVVAVPDDPRLAMAAGRRFVIDLKVRTP